ncbi:MAG: hypothetical protein ACKO2T_03360, partial [Microcystis aeruginosa]
GIICGETVLVDSIIFGSSRNYYQGLSFLTKLSYFIDWVKLGIESIEDILYLFYSVSGQDKV